MPGIYEKQPLVESAANVVQWWRAYLALPWDPTFADRVMAAQRVAVDVYATLVMWSANTMSAALNAGDATLAGQVGQVDKLLRAAGTALQRTADVLNMTKEPTALWAAVAVPLAFAPDSVAHALATARNMLFAAAPPPEVSVTTSSGQVVPLPEWARTAWSSGWLTEWHTDVAVNTAEFAVQAGAKVAEIAARVAKAAVGAAKWGAGALVLGGLGYIAITRRR